MTLGQQLKALAPGLTPLAVLEKFAVVQMIDVFVPTTDDKRRTCLYCSRRSGLLRRNTQAAEARFDAIPGVFAVHFLSNFSLLQQANPGRIASNS